FGGGGVAFSGGVDSSFLLRTALDVLGPDKVLLLHARSCLQKKRDQERADSWLERHGYAAAQVQQRIIALQPLDWQEFVANPNNRCYLCKKKLYQLFQKILHTEGISVLLDGTNSDDLRQGEQGRPGLQALAELGIYTPLADCALSKAEIRVLSKDLQLDTWEQPSSSCLATRIPAGMQITAKDLQWIEALEQIILDSGFQDCRVRLNNQAKKNIIIQLPKDNLGELCSFDKRETICNLLKDMGVGKIFLDLDGR
ncbi:MAG: hypothetical protein D3923_08750, partial [Candidatus Electrothrix sp. AR3]|nr:hypothetical protein [Candidatus Electrothrix sp. AR3]